MTVKEGQASLTECLNRIKEVGMTLKKEKCYFRVKELDFFGVTISANGITPKKGTLDDLQNSLPPTNIKEVHSFLGCTGYFKNRSPYQSSIDRPLRKLIRKGATFKFEEDEQKSWAKLKQIVIEEAMAFFDRIVRRCWPGWMFVISDTN